MSGPHLNRDERARAVFDAAVDLARRRHRSPLAGDVRSLSRQFGSQKGAREAGYLRRPSERRAYLAWYAPRNACRIGLLLDGLAGEGLVPRWERPRVLDLGAGPLAGVLGAWVAYGALGRSLAVDLAAPALVDGMELLKRVDADVERVDTRVANLQQQKAWGTREPADLVVIANAIGEVGDPRRDVDKRALIVEEALARLAPGGRLLVVEPGTRIHGQGLMRLRDELVDRRRGAMLAPCTGARRCPLLAMPGGWCHVELPWTPPESAAGLAREAGLAASPLKHSYLLLANEPLATAAGGLRLVGGLMQSGGVERRYACTADGLVELAGKPRLPPPVREPARGARLQELPSGVEGTVPSAPQAGAPSRDGPLPRSRSRRRRGRGAD
jgi:SAM-dependent methyltransferase